ncbi:2-hydroxychromene-2-carboxylate isomerase [Allopusillimonas ginsengisoli]|uniref:2-hydroxychromene-2-carboxylate isomerase n=1 Tax=Allopusillimonas ginsengisoli TaxID=453575 RepID=UPI00101EB874|nr:2-hydroxychromene-2-carboxylate isomerase [Allopusillimonas ginsengisoli]TEA79513.1 2-hydroxychromene-2-carboxylate isomerase [Allopusillimonas ginsengisoli]
MSQALDFYFEFSSPYGYFASTQIDALARDIGRTVNWHPILLGPMFKAMGSAPLTDIPLKGKYARHDFERTAALFDIPYQFPDTFPIATVGAARATLYVQQHDPQRAVELIHHLYRAYFADGRDISDNHTVLSIAKECGHDPDAVAAGMADEHIKNLLKSEVSQAIERGVFGSPFIIIDNEPFWGFDRFPHIRKWAGAKR